jgi:hypothetical protein
MSGLIMIPQSLPDRVAIDQLEMIWVAMEAEEWHNLVAYLPL